MRKKKTQPNYRRRTLRLPDLDHSKLAVLNSLGSPGSRRVYEYALDQFIAWYCSEPRLAFNRIVVTRYRMHLESRGLAANTINQQLAAMRRSRPRSRRCGPVESRTGSRHQPGQGREATRLPRRELAECGTMLRGAPVRIRHQYAGEA